LPLLTAAGGMAASVAIYLAFNLGRPSAAGWGIALSSDAALGWDSSPWRRRGRLSAYARSSSPSSWSTSSSRWP
jgi:hypothetical protein